MDQVEFRYRTFRDLTNEYAQIDFERRRLQTMANAVKFGETMVDVGCNAGYIASLLPGCIIDGIDPSVIAVEVAQTRLRSAQVGVAESLPFPNQWADVVMLGFILERVFDPQKAISEAARVASRLIVGCTPHEDGPWGPDHVPAHAYDVRCYTRETLTALLAPFGKVGLEVVLWGTTPAVYVFTVEVGR